MARKIEKQYQVKAKIEALTPIHVGGIGDNTLVDLALALDGRGRYYLPGSSIAGVLRSWMSDAIDDGLSDRLFGPQKFNTSGTTNSNNDGHASFILVEDAIIDESLGEEIRDGVGIDRQWGTAADKIKFDRAILPRGTSFNLELTVGLPPTDSQWDLQEADVLDALGALMAALNTGELYFGAAKTRGLGRVQTKGNPQITAVNLLTPKGILDCLRGTGDKQELPDTPRPRPQLTFEIDWQPQGPVMVKAEPDGLTVNILPLTGADGDKLALVLPGSSVKGAIRFQGERILRTLGVAGPETRFFEKTGFLESSETKFLESSLKKQEFFNRLELPLVTTVFGTSKTADGDQKPGFLEKPGFSTDKKPLPGLGALLINDCYSKSKTNNASWQAIATAKEDKELRKALNAAGLDKTQQAYHVAIDRWTGGAAETMLYSGLEPFGIQWEKLRLVLDLNRIPEEEVLVAIAFILIIIRDLSNNRIPLGYGVNRGYGSISINNVFIRGKGFKDAYREDLNIFESGIELPEGDITQLDSSILNRLNDEWKNWLVSSGF
jgi:CRISPR/Cas system CSM-associated protein Csm3 (group 7 of RAMP superfamily)